MPHDRNNEAAPSLTQDQLAALPGHCPVATDHLPVLRAVAGAARADIVLMPAAASF